MYGFGLSIMLLLLPTLNALFFFCLLPLFQVFGVGGCLIRLMVNMALLTNNKNFWSLFRFPPATLENNDSVMQFGDKSNEKIKIKYRKGQSAKTLTNDESRFDENL